MTINEKPNKVQSAFTVIDALADKKKINLIKQTDLDQLSTEDILFLTDEIIRIEMKYES